MEQERDNPVFTDVFNQILTCLDDPDLNVKNTVQLSMLRLMVKRPNETFKLVAQFRAENPNLHSDILLRILVVIQEVLTDKTVILTEDTLNLTIKFLIDDLVDSKCDPPVIRPPSVKGLEELGRINCDEVLEALTSHLKGEPGEKDFVFIYCLGVLADTNAKGVAPHIKRLINIVLSILRSIKNDHIKLSYAYAVRKFSEALMECELENIAGVNETCLDEITQIYDIFLKQWTHSRDSKIVAEVLKALSSMYPLLPLEKISEQSPGVTLIIVSLSQRSNTDRYSVMKFLAAVLKTNSVKLPCSLDTVVHTLFATLFDLVCLNPDYGKPQTIKGHCEVLRCFALLTEMYSGKVTDMLLIQMKNKNDLERVKSLLVLAHLANTSIDHISSSMPAFIDVLKQMITDKSNMMLNPRLLKAIAALAQKSFIKDKKFVWFIVRNSCKPDKPGHGQTALAENEDFTLAAKNVLLMLSSTVGTIDELLKRELLNYFVLLDYTDNCSTIAKCLSNLFGKNPEIEFDVDSDSEDDNAKCGVPSPEAIFARCITLMGNYKDKELVTQILLFLKGYCVNIDMELIDMWDQKIPELLLCNQKEKLFENSLLNFILQTIETLEHKKFAIKLVEKLSEQLILYPIEIPHSAFYIPPLTVERGMLLKCMGICISFLTDVPMIEDNINTIISTARVDKTDLSSHYEETEHAMVDAAKALGYASRVHTQIVFKKLTDLFHMHPKKSRVGFFSNLHFIKDTAKETEWYKVNLLVSEAYGRIIDNTASVDTLKEADNIMISFLLKSLVEAKDRTLKRVILSTLLKIAVQCLKCKDMQYRLKTRNHILDTIFEIPLEDTFENASLFSLILKLGTHLIQIDNDELLNAKIYLGIATKIFFACARHLKTKFDSIEDDERNSLLAHDLNQCLPEMNRFIKVIIQSDPSPSCLYDVLCILEQYMKDSYSEVRICCGHILNSSLEVYIKSVKIGCEAPSKFNQTGDMLGKIVPRCIDSNATVRQTSVDILQKILEISNIYESLTIADSNTDWIRELESIREQIITDDSKEIYQFCGDIACLIASRVPNYQYLQFCKTLLHCVDDHIESSAVGACVVFKYFIEKKGVELFHAIPELIKDCLEVVKDCKIQRAQIAVLKGMLALAKNHPKFVCNEMLAQSVPFEECVLQFWKVTTLDLELIATILENFLATISTASLCEPNDVTEKKKVATARPLSMFCVMNELFLCKDIKSELQHKFPELFAMLLTSMATYTNLASPWLSNVGKSPCEIVFGAFYSFLNTVEMEQIGIVLTTRKNLASSKDLQTFVEILTPMVVAVVNEFSISSNIMKQIVNSFSKYLSSPFDGQRIASIGFYAYLVPLKPSKEISSIILSHLNSALHDPNPIVRGLCIIGFGYVGELNDVHTYAEKAVTALLKGIDDYSSDCFLNIPLESQRGLSRVLKSLSDEHIESFHISLAIRIRPFFENSSVETREAAITLFGDLCQSQMTTLPDGTLSPTCPSEAFKEQLFANLVSLLLHLNEKEHTVVHACERTFTLACKLINTPKDTRNGRYLIKSSHMNYATFTFDFAALMGVELSEHVDDFVESCIPFLKSHFDQVRAFAAIVIGILRRYVKNPNQIEVLGHKLALLLKDENPMVRSHAARGISLFYGEELTSNQIR